MNVEESAEGTRDRCKEIFVQLADLDMKAIVWNQRSEGVVECKTRRVGRLVGGRIIEAEDALCYLALHCYFQG